MFKLNSLCNVGAVESGDHFKNGASSKSHKSRGNNFKYLNSQFNVMNMKIVKVIITAMLFFSLITTATAQENKEEYSELTTTAWWKLEDGLLTITGKGVIPDCLHLIAITRKSKGKGDPNRWLTTPWRSSKLLITSVFIEDGITRIGDAAFLDCKNLNSIHIPESVTSIGEYAFLACENLTSVNIPESVTTLEMGAFYMCKNLTSINIPANLTYSDVAIFTGCHIESVIIPEEMTIIPMGLFSNTHLTSINIPQGVSLIKSSAFQGCKKLMEVEVKAPVPPKIEKAVFFQAPIKKAKLIVPEGSKTAYQEHKDWKKFGIIEER